MIVKTLDGKEYSWTISSKVARGNKRDTSSLHAAAKKILREIYPMLDIYEEVPIIVEKNQKLYLDFYIPSIQTAIEVNGRQHYSFNPYHHKSKMHFMRMKVNDRKKAEWCEYNNIILKVLPYNKIIEWRNIINES